jgi:hypothetical protein
MANNTPVFFTRMRAPFVSPGSLFDQAPQHFGYHELAGSADVEVGDRVRRGVRGPVEQ